ncbi:GumC family protein [Thioclava sp. 15-R06ZXC-3]|uniref:GumC family protein n=1 Tax=Thioclava arctica TaxID=3238301 RepID=A0ABV3TH99_9RHOB
MNQLQHNRHAPLTFAAPDPAMPREADFDLSAMLRMIRRNVRFIGAITALLTLAALPFIIAIDPVYRAQARFLIHPTLAVETNKDAAAPDLSDEVERLRSRVIADQVIARFDLAALPAFNPKAKPPSAIQSTVTELKSALSVTATPNSQPLGTQERILASYYQHLSVWHETKSQVVQISFSAPTPELAAEVPNAMISIYLADREAKHRQRVSAALELLDGQIAEQKDNVAKAAAEVQAYQVESGVTSVGRAETLEQSRIILVNEQLSDIQRQSSELHGKLRSVEAALAGDGGISPDEPEVISDLRKALQLRKRALAQLTASYGDAYGGVLTERAHVIEIENSIRDELTAWAASMRAQIGQLNDDQATLTKNRNTLEGTLSKTTVAELNLINLIRRADAQREILDGYEGQRRQLAARLAQPALDLEMIAPATPPLWPEGRGRKVYLLFTMLAAGLFALTLAGARDLTDRSARSHLQFEDDPDIIDAGMLPILRRRGKTRTADRHLKMALNATIRVIATQEGGALPRSLMVTPVQANDGARFVGYELARELVASGQGVLVIDTLGPTQPWFAKWLPRKLRLRLKSANPGRKGFAEHLREGTDLTELVVTGRATGLRVLQRGNGVIPPLDDALAIRSILKYASTYRLMAIFICPPALSSASTTKIASVMEQVLVVIGWGHSPQEAVRATADHLQMAGVDRVLTVLNRVDARRQALYPFGDGTAFAHAARADAW